MSRVKVVILFFTLLEISDLSKAVLSFASFFSDREILKTLKLGQK